MKYNLLMSYCTFLSFYLLLKVEGKPVDNHPVIHKLTHIKTLFEKLKPLDSKLQYQVDKMSNVTDAKAAQSSLTHKPNLKDLNMVSDAEDDDEQDYDEEDDMEEGESDIEDDMGKRGQEMSDDESEREGKQVGGDVYKAPKLNAMAFEDAKDRKKRMRAEFERKRLGKTTLVEELKREMDDAPEEVFMGGVAKKGKTSRFQDALEREEMENFKRTTMTTKEQKALRNRNFEEMQDKLDTLDDDFAAIQSIVKRTGARETDAAVKSAEKDAAGTKFAKSLKQFIEKPKNAEKVRKMKEAGEEKDRRREAKLARKQAAQKEFQESKLEEISHMKSDITRNINRDMLKAKGIVRKRKKEDANPRVKKRRAYEKLVKAHKTKVREFQDGKSQGLYAGEN